MSQTQTRKNRKAIKAAIEPVLKDFEISKDFPTHLSYLNFIDDLITALLPLMPGYMSDEARAQLGYDDPELNAKLAKEDDMRLRVEETLNTVPTGSPEWTKVIKALVKAEAEKGWDIETFWKWNEHEDQKFEKLRFGDLVKKPSLITSWLGKAFQTESIRSAAPEYDEFGRMK